MNNELNTVIIVGIVGLIAVVGIIAGAIPQSDSANSNGNTGGQAYFNKAGQQVNLECKSKIKRVGSVALTGDIATDFDAVLNLVQDVDITEYGTLTLAYLSSSGSNQPKSTLTFTADTFYVESLASNMKGVYGEFPKGTIKYLVAIKNDKTCKETPIEHVVIS